MTTANEKPKPRFLIQTLGCKVNQYDSERIRSQLVRRGCVSVGEAEGETPNLIIVNTCSVTSESDRKGRQLIRKMIRAYPQARVAVTGCYSERKPEDILGIEGVREVVAIEDQEAWIERLAEELGWGCEDQDGLWSGGIDVFEEHTRAFVKIQDGCDLKCTFCSIPDSRGRARSRLIPEILSESQELARRGYPEIVLCGVCIGHYGRGQNFGLIELLKGMANLKGIKRIRISSLEPQDITEDLLGTMAQHNVVCPHLHLPLQSGSNRILRRMKRPYVYELFKEKIVFARKIMPGFEVSTDIMTGFPGESEEDFECSLQAVREIRFSKVHSFRFSVRENTPAARMREFLPPTVVEERRRRLDEAAKEAADEAKQAYVGRSLPVLAESFREGKGSGFTPNYLRADFTASRTVARGEIVDVRLTRLKNGRLQGTAVD
ncbi:MAG: tRNA (N(6)-L-threonylcarbamoyladenosine(37)-C(2))-methylthiotransferase MtaB [Candidatus Omnitrophota bacterium]